MNESMKQFIKLWEKITEFFYKFHSYAIRVLSFLHHFAPSWVVLPTIIPPPSNVGEMSQLDAVLTGIQEIIANNQQALERCLASFSEIAWIVYLNGVQMILKLICV